MAVAYLGRLNGLLYKAGNDALNLDASSWFHTLLTLHREVITEMNKEETPQAEKYRTTINQQISIWIQQTQRGKTGIPPTLYDSLHNYEIFLRKIMKKAGLQNRTTGDPGTALR